MQEHARQIEGMVAYRRAIKMAIANAMRMGAEGIKIQISGRLNGAERARKEITKAANKEGNNRVAKAIQQKLHP